MSTKLNNCICMLLYFLLLLLLFAFFLFISCIYKLPFLFFIFHYLLFIPKNFIINQHAIVELYFLSYFFCFLFVEQQPLLER